MKPETSGVGLIPLVFLLVHEQVGLTQDKLNGSSAAIDGQDDGQSS